MITSGRQRYAGAVLGLGKLLGVAAILYPKTRLLGEWAFTFDLIDAILSHIVKHDHPLRILIYPMQALALTLQPQFGQISCSSARLKEMSTLATDNQHDLP